MSHDVIVRLLQERTGMQAGALGESAVAAAIVGRLERLGLDAAAYAARLRDDQGEMQALIDAVVVPETWFFRGEPLFSDLARQVATMGRNTPFRALSVACSTGEEPFSLVLALTEAGVAPERYVVEGMDLSAQNIARARAALYRELSFRQMPAGLREHYFRLETGGWRLMAPYRDCVRFHVGNLLDLAPLGLAPGYDLICCRNVLIYFSPEARRQAIEAVLALLAPGGLLAVGPADFLDAPGLVREGPEGHFLWRRMAPQAPGSALALKATRRTGASRSAKRKQEERAAPVASASRPEPVPDLLALARHHADAGQLEDALRFCRAAEVRTGPTADGYSLEGIVHQAARRRDEAIRSFQQALYLNPDHREALLHLLLLYQELGQQPRAEGLRRRLERLGAGGDS